VASIDNQQEQRNERLSSAAECGVIRHVWSVLCRQAFVDPNTDEAALTILEGVSVPGAPEARALVGGTFSLVSQWYCDVGSSGFSYLVKVTGPSGTALAETDAPVAAFLAPKLGARSRVTFPGIAFDGLGVYWFRVMRLVDGPEILDAEIPLQIA
jgi:hypothetical protein